MAMNADLLSKQEAARFNMCPVRCPRDPHRIDTLADYMAVVTSVLNKDEQYRFRGHRCVNRPLVPSALRYKTLDERNAVRFLTMKNTTFFLLSQRPSRLAFAACYRMVVVVVPVSFSGFANCCATVWPSKVTPRSRSSGATILATRWSNPIQGSRPT